MTLIVEALGNEPCTVYTLGICICVCVCVCTCVCVHGAWWFPGVPRCKCTNPFSHLQWFSLVCVLTSPGYLGGSSSLSY